MTRTVDERSEQHVADVCRLDPVTATYLGVAGHDTELTDYSPEGYEARLDLARSALRDVTAATPVDEREAVARDAFLERTGLEVEYDEAGFARAEINVIASPVQAIREVFDLMPTEEPEHWEAIAARLDAVPAALAGLRVTLAEEAAHGRVSAARQYAQVAAQVERWTTGSGVFADLVARGVAAGTVPAGLQPALERGAAAATRAYADLGLFLSDEMEPRGRRVEAVGPEQYALASRLFLGTTIDVEETYAWGWEELARIEADMAATAARVTPDAAGVAGDEAIRRAVAVLEGDLSRRIEGREAFRDWMQQLADTTVAHLADVHFDIPDPMRRIECCLAPTNEGGIYYTGPSEDFSRPGRMWWSVPEGVDTFHPWRETTTVFHEGVPGHHLQVGQTAYRSELLNRWQRTLCWVSGHGEGWALYAERLMDELGHLDDPADRLGMLDAQGFRAARVIVDIGMHLQLEIPADNPFGFHPGERWTPELGLEFMRQHSRDDDATIRFEVDRYLGWPGQAPSYKVGERVWLEMREAAQRRHGSAFDLKAFHRAALDLGSMGLDPLATALARV
ncbi:DUF885 domain-containing protein [Nocardioides zeae]|uniref:DUF885 domain-containing protein n=1 Tax=Nocardioides imazamoxiresistens TaxID=3231893 RepID=A0ABU3PVD8_9ACTN|nr:DUF885 domain-containing protein [Nocardioides zeae]MDT9592710.1 DUF885 domain-containing protein [Nocardioides zeae]